MRRWIFFSILAILLTAAGWRLWTDRRAPAETETVPVVTRTDFSSLRSAAVNDAGRLDQKYTCDGDRTSPPLTFINVPPAVKLAAVIFEDLDAPGGVYDHWVVWNIDVVRREIPAGVVGGVLGRSSNRKNEYVPPCPSTGQHRYRFRLYGYTRPLDLEAGGTKNELLSALDGQALVSAELTATYER